MTEMTQSYDQILAEEAELRFASFSLDDAWRLGCQMRDAAAAAHLPVVVGIVIGQQRVFHAALPGSSHDNDAWLARKTAVVLRYGHSSLAVGEQFRTRGRDFDADSRLDPARFAAHGGVLPLALTSGVVLGAVGISGLPQLEDHAFVAGQVRAFHSAGRR